MWRVPYPSLLGEHFGLTLTVLAGAYALAVAAGLGLGSRSGCAAPSGGSTSRSCRALRDPSVVWYPSLMFFFGLGPARNRLRCALGFFPIVLSVLAGIRQVPATLLIVAQAMGAGPDRVSQGHAARDGGHAGGRAAGGLALSVVGVLVGEILGAREGSATSSTTRTVS